MNFGRIFFFIFIIAQISFARTVSLDSFDNNIQTFQVQELTLLVTDPDSGNPFTDVQVQAVFNTPDGNYNINGFCDAADGTLYKVRFTPMTSGNHSFTITFQDSLGTETLNGSFSVSTGSSKGFIQVDPEYPTRFEFINGGHPFICSKTAWLIAGIPQSNHRAFLDKMVPRGENCIRFGLEFDFSDQDPYVDVWPYANPREDQDYTVFDIDYWRNLDNLLKYAANQGIYAEPVLFTMMGLTMPWEDMQRLMDYLLARTACYPSIIMYQLANERDVRYDLQTQMADYLHANDPYGHLVSTSHPTTTDAAWSDAPWMDVAINHSCRPDDQLFERYYTIANRISGYNMPGWCDETGRENRHDNDDGVHRRKQYWAWNMGGSYWNYHSWEGCEGIMDISYNGPGSQYLQYIRPFWESTEFWRMRPDNSLIQNNPSPQYEWALASDDEVVVYLVNEATGGTSAEGTINLQLPAGHTFIADFMNPANGSGYPYYHRSKLQGGNTVSITFPAFTNDLVLHFYTSDDEQAPQLSNVNADNISAYSARITWDTNEPADGQVEWGLTDQYGRMTLWSAPLETGHEFTLNHLMPGTTYHYRVISNDVAGNQVISNDKTFSTPTVSVQPAISGFTPTEGNMTTTVTVNGSNFLGTHLSPLRMMMLGQGIVRGLTGSADDGGFRSALSQKLLDNEIAFLFTGSQADGIGFDAVHEGYENTGTETLAGNVNSAISAWSPDYLLVYTGAEDLVNGQTPAQVRDEIGSLVDNIHSANDQIIILLGTLLPRTDGLNSNVTQLNTLMDALVTTKQSEGLKIYLVDHNDAFTLNSNWSNELMHNTSYPNAAGYNLMADTWYTGLRQAWSENRDLGLTFNGVAVDAIDVVSEKRVKAQAPPGAVTGAIELSADHGTATSAQDFVVIPVQGNFTADVVSGNAPLLVRFTDITEGLILSYEWDFGDGSPVSTEQNPKHVYTKKGNYTVTLTITDAAGSDSEVKTGYIQVQERSNTPIPPKWVYQPWVWEDGVNTEAEIRALVQGYVDRDIPVGAVNLDSPWETAYNTFEFDAGRYPDARGMIDDFHAMGIKVIAWITPLINNRSLDNPNQGHASNYDFAKQNGYFIDDGAEYEWWKGYGSFIDYTNPDALEWWHSEMDKALDLGLDGWKTDAGNRDFPVVGQGHNGAITAKEYGHLYYMDFYEHTLKSRGQHAILFSKPYDETLSDSMYVPRAYTPTAFVGDQVHDWSSAGLLSALNNVFLSAEDDFVAVGSDIGGFMGATDISKNLLIRWAQFGALCPIMENGGHGEHRPWAFDQETVNIYRYFAKLHSQLAPYFYSYGVVAHNGGRGILRPMEGTWQYKLGKEIFVAAMYQNTTSRQIEFPPVGNWIDIWDDDQVYDPGQILPNYDCPLDRYPVFIKSGSIIPMEVRDGETGYGSEASDGMITYLVYPEGSFSYTFYDVNRTCEFTCNEANDVVQIGMTSASGNAIFRVKYPVAPSAITLGGNGLTERADYSAFESNAAGWYYDTEKKHAWIKTGNQSGTINLEIAPQTTAAFSADPVTGQAPLSVQFTDASIHADAWEWDFGDGSDVSTEQNPQHEYLIPGNYTVTLTVSGASGSDTRSKPNCIQVSSQPHSFSNITQMAGMDLAVRSVSKAASFADVNQDGRYDLFVGNAGDNYPYDFMYLNQNGTNFSQVSSARGVDDVNNTYNIVHADFDNDGDLDAFFSNQPVGGTYMVGRNRMYRNDGNGNYSDITDWAGIPTTYDNSLGAVAADFNGDGWLDLFVTNWGAPNEMYFNDGTGKMVRVHTGTDDDESSKYAVAAADIDNDHDIDLYVCRYGYSNRLYINDGAGNFTQQAETRGVALTHRSRGAVFADVDNDGDLDLFVAKIKMTGTTLPPIGVYMNRGDGTFHDRSEEYDIQASLFAILFADADNDGDLDMFLVRNDDKEPNATPDLRLNDGNGQFTPQYFYGLDTPISDARAGAYADIDNDGDIDFFVAGSGDQNYLFRNELEPNNHYLDVLVKGVNGDYGGMGCRVLVYQPGQLGSNNHILGHQQSMSSNGCLSQNQTALHFGLDGYASCDVRVIHPDGTVKNYTGINANRVLTIEPPSQEPVEPPIVMTPQLSGENNLLLSWEQVADADAYHVYRDVEPWFSPDHQNGSNRLASNVTDQDPNTEGVQWTDPDPVTGDHSVNYFYTITAVRNGEESDASRHIGAFDYELITTSFTDFNEVALPLSKPGLATAADLMSSIPGCNSVAQWNPVTQSYQQYIPGLSFTDFEVYAGYPYYVNVTANTVFSLSGELVDVSYDLITTSFTDFNEVMLPLNKQNITMASELMADIPGCNSVARWNPETQSYQQYIPGLSFTDFATRVGYPYYVNITQDVTWPEDQVAKSVPRPQTVAAHDGPVNTPHLVYGDLTVKDDVEVSYFVAHIRGRDDVTLGSDQSGNTLTDDQWLLQLGGMAGGWQAGDVLCIDFYSGDQIVGSHECELTWQPADNAGTVELAAVVTDYVLFQNYPNPFNPETTIRFGLPDPGAVRIVIHDVTGRRVKTLLDRTCEAGYHRVVWTGVDDTGLRVASGVYFYTLYTRDRVLRHKLMLLR